MADRLPPSIIANILSLRRSGLSIREIARRLGVHRETVGKYLNRLKSQISSDVGGLSVVDSELKRATRQRAGPPSLCEPYRDLIIEKVNDGFTAQKIFQHLLREQNFHGHYYSVRRYVAKLMDKKKHSSGENSVKDSPLQDTEQ